MICRMGKVGLLLLWGLTASHSVTAESLPELLRQLQNAYSDTTPGKQSLTETVVSARPAVKPLKLSVTPLADSEVYVSAENQPQSDQLRVSQPENSSFSISESVAAAIAQSGSSPRSITTISESSDSTLATIQAGNAVPTVSSPKPFELSLTESVRAGILDLNNSYISNSYVNNRDLTSQGDVKPSALKGAVDAGSSSSSPAERIAEAIARLHTEEQATASPAEPATETTIAVSDASLAQVSRAASSPPAVPQGSIFSNDAPLAATPLAKPAPEPQNITNNKLQPFEIVADSHPSTEPDKAMGATELRQSFVVAAEEQELLADTLSFTEDPQPLALVPVQFQEPEAIEVDPSRLLGLSGGVSDSSQGIEFNLTRQLVGLFVDGEEQPALIAAHDGNEYLLPLVTILESVGASIDPADDADSEVIRISTPGGAAQLTQQDLRIMDGQVMVTQTALAEKLLVDVNFDQSKFAIYLVLPWSLIKPSQLIALTTPVAQFTPPAASIRNMRGDITVATGDDQISTFSDYYMAGNLAGGVWQTRVFQDSDGEIRPSEYYFTREIGNSLALVGNSDFSLHPLLPSVEQTGAQFLYSSAPLPSSRNVDFSQPNSTRLLNNGIRNIAGMATPGAVAELRIDGSALARTRVRLDGSYEFPEVELPTRGYAEVLVLILDNRSGSLLETQDFSRRSGIELLGEGQSSVFTALGMYGNPLVGRAQASGSTAAAQLRYGLTEDLTLEIGHQQIAGQQGSEAALSMAISSTWFASLGYAETSERNSVSLDLEGGNDTWSFDLNAREISSKLEPTPTNPEAQQRQWSRSLNFRYQLGDNFNLGLVGRDSYSNRGLERFILPSAGWTNRRNLSVNIRPNYSGEYRIDSRFTPNMSSTVRYTYEDERHLLDIRRRTRGGQEYYASYSADEISGDRSEIGVVSNFDNERFGRLQFGLVNSADTVGYAMDWESRLFPGVNSHLRLSQGGNYDEYTEEDSGLFLQWQVTLDFAVAQRRIVPADSSAGDLHHAALTGDLLLAGEKISAKYDVDRIELLIDGDNHTAKVQGGRYYIDGLQPGLHKVSIDAKYLPLEISPEIDQNFWVRLEKSAATEVPLALEVKYSFAGRVRNSSGDNLGNERLIILDSKFQPIGQLRSDQFGLYRTDNLSPGRYHLVVDRGGISVASIEINVTDAYLFEQDIVIAESNASVEL